MLKQYDVKYNIKPIYAEITVMAESAEEAQEEIERVFQGDTPIRGENQWIDQDVLWNVEWYTDVEEVEEVE